MTEQSTSRFELRDTHLLAYVVALTILDRIITVAHFELEANQSVSILGPGAWVVLTVVLLGALVYVSRSVDHWITTVCLWFLAFVTLLAVVSNRIMIGTI